MDRPFQVFFVPIAHHDLGYTRPIDALLKDYCEYYNQVLDFCDLTADYPYESQFRYSVEEFWSLDYWLKQASKKTSNECSHMCIRDGSKYRHYMQM